VASTASRMSLWRTTAGLPDWPAPAAPPEAEDVGLGRGQARVEVLQGQVAARALQLAPAGCCAASERRSRPPWRPSCVTRMLCSLDVAVDDGGHHLRVQVVQPQRRAPAAIRRRRAHVRHARSPRSRSAREPRAASSYTSSRLLRVQAIAQQGHNVAVVQAPREA